ncbi:MAG: MHYT domain-containing protein, partial [Pseudomonadota bacterium]
MLFSYDLQLVVASIVVATVGAYASFDLMVQYRHAQATKRKPLLAASAVAMGGSIWAMHFIAMLAVQLPVEIRFDVLTTFVSAIVSILATGVALVIGVTSAPSRRRTILGGVVMGAGIAAMHYIGMGGIRANCVISYELAWVVVSIVIAVATSVAAIAAGMTLRGFHRRAVAAALMGVSVSGMHYSSMVGTAFRPAAETLTFAQPMLSAFGLGMTTALVTFLILGFTLWILVPDGSPDQAAAMHKTVAPASIPD